MYGVYIGAMVVLGFSLACAVALSVFLCVKRVKLDVPRILQLILASLTCACALVAVVLIAGFLPVDEAAFTAASVMQSLSVSLLVALVLVLLYVWSLAVHSPFGMRPTFEAVWTVGFVALAIAVNVAAFVIPMLQYGGVMSGRQTQLWGLVLSVLLAAVATALLVYTAILLFMVNRHQQARDVAERRRSLLVISIAFFCVWGAVVALTVVSFILVFQGIDSLNVSGALFTIYVVPYAVTSWGVLFLILFSVVSTNATPSMDAPLETPLLDTNTVPPRYDI
jgi:hypothetical protein